MNLVVIESPYAGDVAENLRFVRACMADCLRRGEAPYASHALYTQEGVLNDDVPKERALGIKAGFAWGDRADITAVYVDRGCSKGMRQGIARALKAQCRVEFRCLLTSNENFARCAEWSAALERLDLEAIQ